MSYEGTSEIIFGDCREALKVFSKRGVKAQMCVTSPPYFGLRDYGVSSQIGLENSPAEYVAEMVSVFRHVRDVLSDDGTLWLNIGDSYAANRSYQVPSTKGGRKHGESQAAGGRGSKVPEGMKAKDLMGIPWMLAFALRDDGWYLRQEIIWHSPNSMPERVTDRCVGAHEHIFLFSKRSKYYFDFEAIQETSVGGGRRRKRDVWVVNSAAYRGAHGAVFPPKLIEPCVLAGSRPGDVVLDPFMGSGTTAEVALRTGRAYIGCELNAEYKTLIDARVASVSQLFKREAA
ncbi:site-specific DNA-methyltransferase [Burkholderia sp. FERM BP-3421]|uniref:DNA-methyltransferase n=1 Tax=Burkholderia sp. FERM BP-3421 TaxID=1494466 RepID=UPI0023629509|nr:site-specific DNA-methyltransferase [Burkholderia sp. FERM BP-3421]WDD93863.1 site-specific DNA-methyltransferase [Burkholderia sp. FERM BP-3421]